MRKMLITAAAILVGTGAFASEHKSKVVESDVVITPYLGCYAKTDVEKLLTDGNFTTLLRANGPDGRVNELWINGTGYTATVAYKDHKNSIDKVCVTNVTKSTVYNGDTIKAMNFSPTKK